MIKKTLILLFIMVFTIPFLCFSQTQGKKAQRMSFDFVDADVRNVLRGLAEVMGKNIIIGDDVKELKDKTITMKLDNVSMEEALDVIIKSKDLSKFEEENIIRVITTKKFDDEKLKESKRRDELFKEKLERLRLGTDFVSREIKLKYASADEVKKWIMGETSATAIATTAGALPLTRPGLTAPGAAGVATVAGAQTKGLLSESGVVTTVPWNNRIITIKDTKDIVESIEKRLKELDLAPEQIQIEARIVEAATSFARNLGIQWSAQLKATVTNTSPPVLSGKDVLITPGVKVPLLAAAGTIGILIGSAADSNWLDVQISALERDGTVKVIASPKIVTSNFKDAKISAGREVPYQSSGQYGTNTEFKKAELELNVTPQVIGDEIKLKILAKKNEPEQIVGGGIPAIITREIDIKEVIIKDGETVVLGGIYDMTESVTDTGIPFFKDIPIVGWFFKKQEKSNDKRELLIFVTPRIIKNLYKEGG
jgi:type IV pilus assembly protein PilQ